MKHAIVVLGAAALLSTAGAAEAKKCRRINKTQGAVVGAVAGGVLGNVIGGHGHRTTGTVVGAAAGGAAGHEIARKKYNQHCR